MSETLTVSPSVVDLGPTAPSGSVQQRLVIKGDEAFTKIREIECSDDRFEFETRGQEEIALH